MAERDRRFWLDYLRRRVGTYEYRTRRYAEVADRLELLGLADGDLVVDVGAGMCEFGRYLYRDRGWSGRYLPVDGAIDGCDLERWNALVQGASLTADFFVAVEVLEHLRSWDVVLGSMLGRALKGVVITTPNSAAVDTLALDETHVVALVEDDLRHHGLSVEEANLFGAPGDTLVGWRGPPVDELVVPDRVGASKPPS